MIAAEANADLSRSRYRLPLVGLAVGPGARPHLSLGPPRLVPLLPVVLATGWSALVVGAMDVALNPMSATLGALVIAISTEFSVLLSARYHEERGVGLSVGGGVAPDLRAHWHCGPRLRGDRDRRLRCAPATTDIRMLRDFGLVTVADLASP